MYTDRDDFLVSEDSTVSYLYLSFFSFIVLLLFQVNFKFFFFRWARLAFTPTFSFSVLTIFTGPGVIFLASEDSLVPYLTSHGLSFSGYCYFTLILSFCVGFVYHSHMPQFLFLLYLLTYRDRGILFSTRGFFSVLSYVWLVFTWFIGIARLFKKNLHWFHLAFTHRQYFLFPSYLLFTRQEDII